MSDLNVTVAKCAGFCFGVNRAVTITQEGINSGKKIATLGPIIHNKFVVDEFAKQGVRIINSPLEANEDETVVIRSHGVTKQEQSQLEERKIDFIDATCPFVKKIHNIVSEAHEKGSVIIIIGDKNHPEVIGINGWCDNSAFIVKNEEEAEKLPFFDKKDVCIVAQTTFEREIWKKITKILKNTCQSAMFFDTICSATNERQKYAAELANISDVFIVVGGKHSSNTKKLFDIASRLCKHTFLIEDASELPENITEYGNSIGITAGASTPERIIKEVLQTMVEEKNTNIQGNGEPTFAEAFEESLVTLNTGQVVNGTVISITPTEVYVDLGYKADGIIPADELTDDPTATPADVVSIGQEVEVFVVRVNDVEGYVKLSKKKIDAMKGWKSIEDAYESGEILTGRIIENVNKGVIATVNGCRIFIPASHAAERFISDLAPLVGTEAKFKIVNIREDRRGKKAIGSIKVVASKEREEKVAAFMSEVEVGKTYTGTVKTLTNFGAFVDIGGVDGLIHISQLSWQRIKHPSEVLNVGDSVEVYILEVNKETGKVSLGFKRAEDNPWEIAKSKFNEGDIVNVKVVRLVPFGAFVELINGVDGLIHISQIADKRIGKVSDVLNVGDFVDAKITEINWDEKKIGLSIRVLIEEAKKDEETSTEDAPADVEVNQEEVAEAPVEE
ncbi:MAG: bifunctional 4-hydroxy-3-methylbut-2-enyl diphosphate reductase/30S ribosomal protein S1 [Clostridia bacterium]|nr:bifunctional 4-hydroxy-3-methylbut-2-enyl diphosphate reductase/30S ribosomal protein S1 [Clostridia bacterium]